MKPKNSQYLPNNDLTRDEMREIQVDIGGKAIFSGENIDSEIIIGIDQAFTENKAVSAAVAMKKGEIIEKVSAAKPIEIPYIPGFLAFREAPVMISALKIRC